MNMIGEDKMRQIKKHNYYFIFSLAELILLLVFSINVLSKAVLEYDFCEYPVDMSGDAVRIYTEKIGVPEGIYKVTVQYEKDRGNGLCYAQASEKGVHSLYSDRVRLSYLQSERSFDIYVNDDVDDLQLVVEAEVNSDFWINRIYIETASNSKIYQIFCMAVKLLILNAIVAVIYYRNKKFKKGTEVVCIFVIGMIASLGLMEEYILYGHDLMFHLMRIEGLKDGLLAGGYPVRLQPNWFNGWGYPVSIMYGDQLLYFPAFLRLAGVSLHNAYKCYIAAVNIGTAAVAYYAFFKISKDKKTALFGSCLYTLSPYRLSCIYVRAALGEYSAMLFLPLVILCFWYAFEAKEDEKITYDKLAAPVVGFTGLIQTHVLSCFLTAFMIIIFCILCFKRIFRKNVLTYLFQTAFITILVNLWFIVPFFQYMGEAFVVNAEAEMTPAFQRWGANFAELFAVYWNGTLNSTWGEIASISQKFPKPIGTAYLMILIIVLCMYAQGKIKLLEKKIFICSLFFLLSGFMASTAFPYYAINKILPALGSLFLHIQFSYRFLTMAGLFGSVLAVFVMMEIAGTYGKKAAMAAAALVGLISVLQGAQFIYSAMYRGDVFLAYDIAALDNNAVSTGEYLYEGSNGPATEGQQFPVGEGAVIEGFQKRYNEITLTCKSEKEDACILMPLFYYIGYEARDVATNRKLELVRSTDNNRIRVNLPQGYEGTFQVRFKELPVWRAAKLTSLLVILFIFCNWIIRKKKSCTAYLKRV
ncbi:MAG: YfhO family protein [Lachnospiraceae bacterium]|nr:YfhO family protein [Lachnospiraceae bacterium]